MPLIWLLRDATSWSRIKINFCSALGFLSCPRAHAPSKQLVQAAGPWFLQQQVSRSEKMHALPNNQHTTFYHQAQPLKSRDTKPRVCTAPQLSAPTSDHRWALHRRRRRRCRRSQRSGSASVWLPHSLRRAPFSSACQRASWKAGTCLLFSCLWITRQTQAGLREAAPGATRQHSPRYRVQRENEVKEQSSSPKQPSACDVNAGLQLPADVQHWQSKSKSIKTSAPGFKGLLGGISWTSG